MFVNKEKITNRAFVFGKSILKMVNFLVLWGIFFTIATTLFTKKTFGDVSLPQMLFFMMYNNTEGVESELVYKIIFYMGVFPLFGALAVLFVLKKIYNGKFLFCDSKVWILYLLFLFLIGWGVFYKLWMIFDCYYLYNFVLALMGLYLLNECCNFNEVKVFVVLGMAIFMMAIGKWHGYGKLLGSLLEFDTTNFYEENYKYVGQNEVKFDKKRNVIVIFAESFEKKFARIEEENKVFSVNDEKAVKFANLSEGWSQNWTQGALFSAFTGVHIHYLSSYFRYGVKGFKFHFGQRVLMATNNLGENFDFNTPNIGYLGDISSANGYNNLFMQGGKLKFSGTDKFLLNHGFSKENVYDMDSFEGTKEYETARKWWGVNDKVVFDKFKKKINELEKDKPFLAVMFTLDLHRGNNPFFESLEAEAKETINNLNEFIAWFEKQDFYENTTLIVVGDHRRMGKKDLVGDNVYNAFFNLPKNLEEKVNENRVFNQIDLFPTILEIMGGKLKDGKAGVGVSVFSENKTIAERLSHEEQEETLLKIDRFYQKIWEEKKNLFRKGNLIKPEKKSDKFIAHGSGVIDGNVYTNSIDGLLASKQRGYKYIEIDMIKTDDKPYRIIGAHDKDMLLEMLGKDRGDKIIYDEIKNSKLLNKYGILDDEKILEFFKFNKELWLVVDKIEDLRLLNDKFIEIKDRMIVEVFSLEKYFEAKRLGFLNVAYNVKKLSDVKLVLDNGIYMITISLRMHKSMKKELKSLKENGVLILGYSAKNFDEVLEMENEIDMFYYDGEESLSEF